MMIVVIRSSWGMSEGMLLILNDRSDQPVDRIEKDVDDIANGIPKGKGREQR